MENVLVLAYLGDSVYEVYIRKYLIDKKISKVNNLQKEAIKYVSAKGQALTIDKIMEELNDDEISIYKRGRNTNIPSVSKHVDVIEYKKATGFESLIGYLYVTKQTQRLEYIVKKCIECFN